MFTSRAEHRLVLREDNTLDRLLGLGNSIGLISQENLDDFQLKKCRRAEFSKLLDTPANPSPDFNGKLERVGTVPLKKPSSYKALLRRPEINVNTLLDLGLVFDASPEITEAVEIEVKYAGYIDRQNDMISQARKLEDLRLPDSFKFSSVRGLSAEEIEKLETVSPATLGQASRISGVNPSAIQAIMVFLKAHRSAPGEEVSWTKAQRR